MFLKEQSTPFGQTSRQTTIFPTNSLDFIGSVSGIELNTRFAFSYAQAESGVSSFQYPKPEDAHIRQELLV